MKKDGKKNFDDLIPRFTPWESAFYRKVNVVARVFRQIGVSRYGDKRPEEEALFQPSIEVLVHNLGVSMKALLDCYNEGVPNLEAMLSKQPAAPAPLETKVAKAQTTPAAEIKPPTPTNEVTATPMTEREPSDIRHLFKG